YWGHLAPDDALDLLDLEGHDGLVRPIGALDRLGPLLLVVHLSPDHPERQVRPRLVVVSREELPDLAQPLERHAEAVAQCRDGAQADDIAERVHAIEA